jgi:predicted small lipoprotein YifL
VRLDGAPPSVGQFGRARFAVHGHACRDERVCKLRRFDAPTPPRTPSYAYIRHVMKHTTILISILAIAACGGKKPAPKPPEPKEAEAEPPPAETKAPEPEPAPAPEPPPPPPPKTWHAQAQLAPVKGAKLKGATVTFTQQEGGPVSVASTGWFDGIKAGKYHLLVHQNSDCGANASKAGKPVAGSDVAFTAAKGMDALALDPVATLQLDGDTAIVGHTLVLHADQRGKPGKALACGPIAAGE